LKFFRVLSLLLIFTLVFSGVPNLAAAAETAATVEKLVKTAELQSSKLVKQMSSSNAKDINVISTATTNNLTTAIKKAKTSVSKFTGKQKAAFEKRMKTVEQTLVNAKTYNATIVSGNKLTTQFTTYKKTFDSKPFETEKLYTALKASNDQFTKSLSKLAYKGSQTAFAAKYQTAVKKELTNKKEFYDIQTRIGSFIAFTATNEDTDVWDEFYMISEDIEESSLDESLKDLLFEKWYGTYHPVMVQPEEENIHNYVNNFFNAINARDANAIAELYPTETEEQKQVLVENFKIVLAELPESYSIKATDIYVEFVYKTEASVYIETLENIDGVETKDAATMFLTKAGGKWIFLE
jgi:hypothetical protein